IGTLILSDPNLYSGVRMLDMWENPATGICRNREDLESALDRVETLDVEGLIAIDANQNMTKVKTQWYKTVKSARTDLNRALKGKLSDRAQKIINALADNDRTLQDFLVDDIRGSKTLNLPIIAELVGIEAFQ
ncbi:hypothetical protein, partial [Klebsiella pneumoniae]|uniref:hypothetical protein n=1 Tax=Klebsiella pneumoniae TaxID=573 RepID=UPI001E3CF3B9